MFGTLPNWMCAKALKMSVLSPVMSGRLLFVWNVVFSNVLRYDKQSYDEWYFSESYNRRYYNSIYV